MGQPIDSVSEHLDHDFRARVIDLIREKLGLDGLSQFGRYVLQSIKVPFCGRFLWPNIQRAEKEPSSLRR